MATQQMQKVRIGQILVATAILWGCIMLFGGCDVPGIDQTDVARQLSPVDVGPYIIHCPSAERLIISDSPLPGNLESSCSVGSVKTLASS